MLCVLLRALEAHKVALPPPGPKCHQTAVQLLLRVTKKRPLPEYDDAEQPFDLDAYEGSLVYDTSSELSQSST
eukprot:6183847-Pleurochrysis_carterae.AAC.1